MRRRMRVLDRVVSIAVTCMAATQAAGCKGSREKRESPPAVEQPATSPVAKPQPNTADGCSASATWISNPSRPDGSQFTSASNCEFHQWAYQTFLWLVSPVASDAEAFNYAALAYPQDLFVLSGKGPSSAYPGRASADGGGMLLRTQKSQTTADIADVFQAGPGNKLLVDQAGNPVYYSTYLDEHYWNFVVTNQLYDLATLRKTPATLDFPVDALEVKASWRVAAKLDGTGKPIETFIDDAATRFHTVTATIPGVTIDPQGHVQEDPKTGYSAQMALVGMHVTGVVKGHPEFIWATFEHVDNAPDCTNDPPASGPNPTTKQPWSLYADGTPRNQCNQFDEAKPLAVPNICRVHPWGGGNEANTANIRALNASVRALEGDSVWTNYELVGAVWTNGDVPLNNGAFASGSDGKQIGSIQLANASLETFTQDANCFACHNGGAHVVAVGNTSSDINAKSINLSHFVVNYQAVQEAKQAGKGSKP